MEGLSWEEKYLRLRDEHTSLTQKANEQDDTIRRLSVHQENFELLLIFRPSSWRNDGVHPHHHHYHRYSDRTCL